VESGVSAASAPTPGTRSGTIPRLQELEFLAIAAHSVAAGGTYDEVRRGLIDFMAAQRERIAPSGYHAGHAGLPMAKHHAHRYMSNATEALAELMRLGWIEKAPLPTTRKAALLYTKRTFELTGDGRDWIAQLGDSRSDAFDQLLRRLWVVHPQLAGFLRLLSRQMFVVPTAKWGEVHSERIPAGEGRETYMRFLAVRAAEAVGAGATGWSASYEEILQALHAYVDARLESAARRRKLDPYPRSRDFVGACEEGLVSFAFSKSGLTLDYISHEIIRRWTKSLAVANFSYHVPAAPALRLWATADFKEDETRDLSAVRRRGAREYADRVLNELPAAYELTRRRSPGNPWVPIYQVRATVCSKLGLGDRVFDHAVIDYLAASRGNDAAFTINLDPAEYGSTPPTERPLEVPDRSGRTRVFRVMTLVPRARKEPR
jgi:hypothetical protein